MNFLKRKKSLIEMWTTVEGLTEIPECLPRPANKFIPDWLKKMKTSFDSHKDVGTIKNCPVVPEYLTQGYIIPMWCDTILKVDKDANCEWETSSSEFSWSIHSNYQCIDHLPKTEKQYVVFKANCPWHIRTPKGYSCYQNPLFYHFNEDYDVMPGSIQTDIHCQINQQILVERNTEIFIPRGTPFAWYIPYKREEYDFECTEMNEEKSRISKKNALTFSTKFRSSYNIMLKESKHIFSKF